MAYKFNPFTGNLDEVAEVREDILLHITDESAFLALGVAYTIKKWPRQHTVTGLPLWMLNTPAKGTSAQFDIRINGTSIFATLPTVDANEDGSDTAATPAVFSAAFIAGGQVIPKYASVTFHVLQVGSDALYPGGGAKVVIPVTGAG